MKINCFVPALIAALLTLASGVLATEKKAADPAAPKSTRVLPTTPAGVTCITNVLAKYPEHTVEVIVYVPDKPGVYPTILDIHGGGWSARQVENDKPMMGRLATRGFVTALVSYRLSTEAKYPAALSDCKAAVRFLRANAVKFKIDAERIGVMGGSAGGHLSGLLAMTSGKPEFEGDGPYREYSSAVKACIVMASTMDLYETSKANTSTNAIQFFGVKCSENPELYKQVSPITHVSAKSPPTLFIEGEKDTLKVGRAEMQAKFKAAGVETGLFTLKDAPHPFWMRQPWLDETVEHATEFFHRHLGSVKSDGKP